MNEQPTALAAAPRPARALSIAGRDPRDVVAMATTAANELRGVVRAQDLATQIQGREFVRVEGWTTLAAMLGLFTYEESTEEIAGGEGVYRSYVQLRALDGTIVARASAECGWPDEVDNNGRPMWAARPRYARRSMAITRATGKACRMGLSWVMRMAGYEGVPAEEMEGAGALFEGGEAPVRAPRQGNAATRERMARRQARPATKGGAEGPAAPPGDEAAAATEADVLAAIDQAEDFEGLTAAGNLIPGVTDAKARQRLRVHQTDRARALRGDA